MFQHTIELEGILAANAGAVLLVLRVEAADAVDDRDAAWVGARRSFDFAGGRSIGRRQTLELQTRVDAGNFAVSETVHLAAVVELAADSQNDGSHLALDDAPFVFEIHSSRHGARIKAELAVLTKTPQAGTRIDVGQVGQRPDEWHGNRLFLVHAAVELIGGRSRAGFDTHSAANACGPDKPRGLLDGRGEISVIACDPRDLGEQQ